MRNVGGFILFCAVALATLAPAHAGTEKGLYREKLLYSFCAQQYCSDGEYPIAGLIGDARGNLYGVTFNGGTGNGGTSCSAYGCGTVFEVTPAGKEKVLYSFCTQVNCIDGSYPGAALIADAHGNLYGTTREGGTNCAPYGCGTVFEVTPNGQETVLHSFGSGSDGVSPYAAVIADAKGNLYGTTYSGGDYDFGTVFKVTAQGNETVLHSFNGADGGELYAGLVMDNSGNLYGTTLEGGENCAPYACGVVFEVTNKGVETALYYFCGTGCDDGAEPDGSLIIDAKGNLYGTTSSGGAHDDGTVFEVTGVFRETTLYSFCEQAACADGDDPRSGLIADAQGNLYGTTNGGGNTGCDGSGCGTVFELTLNGNETVLHSFCEHKKCARGSTPEGTLISDAQGNLYGVTVSGGANGFGTVFELEKKK